MADSLLNKVTETLQDWIGPETISAVQPVDILRVDGSKHVGVLAAVDTLNEQSEIDKSLAIELEMYSPEQVVDRVPVQRNGRQKLVDVITVTCFIQDQPRTSNWLVTDRSQEKNLVRLGKRDVAGFLIQVPARDEASLN